jgi:hypothetical protein
MAGTIELCKQELRSKKNVIAPHIPDFDKSNRTDGTFYRVDFKFDPQRDRYTCPSGKELVQFRGAPARLPGAV